MISIRGHDAENRRIYLSIDRSKIKTIQGIRKGWHASGKDLRATSSKLILEKPKHGRTYLVRLRGKLRRHLSSAPFEAPANLTGSLKKSIDFLVSGEKSMKFGSKDESTKGGVSYGKALELGDKSRNLEKRPYLLPSIKLNEKNIVRNLELRTKSEIEKG